MDFSQVFFPAIHAAYVAKEDYEKTNPSWYPCGFAWVKIKPARGPFVAWCKKNKLGRRDDYAGGFVISSNNIIPTYMGQAMGVKEAACEAFAEVLRANGIDAYVETRMD